jgi:hypothetical protein
MKQCCHILRQRIFEAAIAEAEKPAPMGFGFVRLKGSAKPLKREKAGRP